MKRILLGLLVGLALLAVGRRLRSPADEMAAEGNDAYHRGDYAGATQRYEKAVPTSVPSLVAHNHAAALYRQERFEEADRQYERSATGSEWQAARAAYDRGNCALSQATHADSTDRELLTKAAEEYRACLQHENNLKDAGQLFADARHNLELAKQLSTSAHEAAQSPADRTQARNGTEKEEECPLCKWEREQAEREQKGWNSRGKDPSGRDGAAKTDLDRAAEERAQNSASQPPPRSHAPT